MPLPENNDNAEIGNAEKEALDLNKTMEMPSALLAAAQPKPAPAKAARPKIAKPKVTPAKAVPEPAIASQDAPSEDTPKDEVNSEEKAEIADDALIGTADTSTDEDGIKNPRRRVWLSILAAVIAIPILLTLIGALTSPPHVKGIPSGQLVYLEADAPSEHTTTLRGLFVAGTDGATRLLVHETEPQDTDDGVREWITQPTLSPDGTQIAFEKQLITLQEDKQAIDNQIWVMPLTPGTRNPPHLVIDLTQQKLKQIIGLTWDSDSSLLFLEDGLSYSVATETDDAPLITPLDLHGLTLAKTDGVSATRSPALTEAGTFAYGVLASSGPQVLTLVKGQTTSGPTAALFALSPLGDKIAFVPPGKTNTIRLYDIARGTYDPDIPVRWGWSVFGERSISSLRWSPDSTQIAFTVSKPPVPEDEIFVVTLASGQTVQLPYRTGRAAWDWGK